MNLRTDFENSNIDNINVIMLRVMLHVHHFNNNGIDDCYGEDDNSNSNSNQARIQTGLRKTVRLLKNE